MRTDSDRSRESGRRLRAALRCVALGALLALPSCFTAALWGVDVFGADEEFPDPPPAAGADESDVDWSTEAIMGRVLLTPIAVGLDLLTCPIQAWLLGLADDDDEGHDRRRRRRDPDPCILPAH
ncbi:MAG: hypothetical protein IPM29_27505 [Planctomycetes bacterium]|nr:hypothetical protein [Planctomycetota bacterium]